VSSRREEKERLRREREEREQQAKAAQSRQRLIGIGAAAALVVAVIVAGVLLLGGGDDGGGSVDTNILPTGGSVPEQEEFDLGTAAEAAGCALRSVAVGANGRDHTNDPNERVKYGTNPPTSGRHFGVPAEDGAYTDAPTTEAVVHALEHGRVVVWYKPSLPRAVRADLKALFDEDTYQMLLIPRERMPYPIAASAWNAEPTPNGTGRLLACERTGPELWDALRAFRDEHRSNGPEAIP
jgi:hypothetical protein